MSGTLRAAGGNPCALLPLVGFHYPVGADARLVPGRLRRLAVPDALVLNATYEPLCVVSSRRAVVLVLTDKAVVVAPGAAVLHSATQAVVVPAVVRLTRFVKVPYRATVPL